MEGEHIEMIIGGWSSSELREKALTELVEIREKLACQLSDLSKYEVRHEVDIRTIESLQNILRLLNEGDKPTQKRKPGWKTLSELVRGLTKRATDGVVCSACKSTNAFEAVICVDCGAHTAPRR